MKKILRVYLIKSTKTKKTYVGSTKYLSRRIRQHNGEIKGGAKYTKGFKSRPWQIVLYVEGFQSWKETLSFEWHIKHNYVKKQPKYGIEYRIKAVYQTVYLFNCIKNIDSDYKIIYLS